MDRLRQRTRGMFHMVAGELAEADLREALRLEPENGYATYIIIARSALLDPLRH